MAWFWNFQPSTQRDLSCFQSPPRLPRLRQQLPSPCDPALSRLNFKYKRRWFNSWRNNRKQRKERLGLEIHEPKNPNQILEWNTEIHLITHSGLDWCPSTKFFLACFYFSILFVSVLLGFFFALVMKEERLFVEGKASHEIHESCRSGFGRQVIPGNRHGRYLFQSWGIPNRPRWTNPGPVHSACGFTPAQPARAIPGNGQLRSADRWFRRFNWVWLNGQSDEFLRFHGFFARANHVDLVQTAFKNRPQCAW